MIITIIIQKIKNHSFGLEVIEKHKIYKKIEFLREHDKKLWVLA